MQNDFNQFKIRICLQACVYWKVRTRVLIQTQITLRTWWRVGKHVYIPWDVTEMLVNIIEFIETKTTKRNIFHMIHWLLYYQKQPISLKKKQSMWFARPCDWNHVINRFLRIHIFFFAHNAIAVKRSYITWHILTSIKSICSLNFRL